ncbi:5-oxoprolinase subunit PxpB [Rariglobus hedericola]|uniref:5-oxoprolinase subunit PxpB n=1 Tax=Rariglobus hedericola TaxID=2597822 RepID=A0A556QND2_9BACT|nr:5-oxoprolinase subunit PxpB [Rariglobus hedericola]TSJ78160.1 5-oxoprolinase subunit PxpB [Rariglobus hedericola]
MQLIPLGDCAVLVVLKAKTTTAALDAVTKLARALNAATLAGVTDIVPAFTTVTVHYDPARVAPGEGTPVERVSAWIKTVPAAPAAVRRKPAEVTVPVCYGGEQGPDLAVVAAHTKLVEAEVIRVHSKAVYRVAAVGFSPGFPYLLGMAPRLSTPRRATPRTLVPAGSVGIGGSQTGVYPSATPGGWALIGRTPLRLFRPESEAAPTLLEAGDTVKFVPITEKQAAQLEERPVVLAAAKVTKSSGVFEVIKTGVLTTVQDMGRNGRQHHGIPVGGPMDRQAARVANLLLGNDENEPLLEVTLTGPVLKFLRDTWIAVTGSAVRDVPGWRPYQVKAGQVVSLAELTCGARAYVAVAGGLEIANVLGGAGTLLRAGVGGWNGRALQAGDRIGAKAVVFETTGSWSASAEFNAATGADVVVRFMRGPQWDWFAAASRRSFLSKTFKVTAQSDRMGIRLEGSALRLEDARELTSEGVGFGSVQVPPDGKPIVLMADRQTIGGYPKIGHVIAVDLPRLAQARTGDLVRFHEISIDEAQALYLAQEHALALLGAGVRSKLKRG